MATRGDVFLGLVITIILIVNFISASEFWIDTEEQLDLVLGSNTRECDYKMNASDLCKTIEGGEEGIGFWSSCAMNLCIIPISVQKLGRIPKELKVFVYVEHDSGVYFHYTTPDGPHQIPGAPSPITEVDWGWSDPIDLTDIPFTQETEIHIIVSSDLYPISVVDKIVFTFDDVTPTTDQTETSTNPAICQPGIYCIATDRYNEVWIVCAGELGTKNCPNDATGNVTWFCQDNATFSEELPEYINCRTDWIDEIEVEPGLPIPSINASHLINTIEANAKAGIYFGHEIGRIANISRMILGLISTVELQMMEKLTDNTWENFGIMLSAKDKWDELSTLGNRSRIGTEFFCALELASLELTFRIEQNETQDNDTNEDSVYKRNFNKFEEFRISTGIQRRGTSHLSFPDKYSRKESHLDLPSNWAQYFEEERVQFVGLTIRPEESNYIFPGHFNNSELTNKESLRRPIVNSQIVGFSFGGLLEEKFLSEESLIVANIVNQTTGVRNINFTGDGVRITLRHELQAWGNEVTNVRRNLHPGEKPKAVMKSAACVFWNPQDLIWSTDGCRVVKSNREETICECQHLTAFALLMDVHNYVLSFQGKDMALELLTLILCPLSILSLAICLFIFFKVQTERSPRITVAINVSICLLIGNLLVLFVMDKHYFNLSDGLCIASAISIHYIFLCGMMWMGLEGLLILNMISLDVFNQGKNYMRVKYCVAYGVPAIIVGAMGVLDVVIDEHVYGNDAYCWLNEIYIWAFMGPTSIILTANLFVLIFSLRKAHNVSNNPNAWRVKKKTKFCSDWIKGSFSLSTVLGLTWISGYFMAIDNSVQANIAAYVFTVLNASQGIFLFIFHGVMNPKVIIALKNLKRNQGPKKQRIDHLNNNDIRKRTLSTSLPAQK